MYILDLMGIIVFAISGSLAAGKKQLDLFGVVVLAIVTAVGGGTIRDLVLGATPVFWIENPVYIYTAAITAIATFFISRFYKIPGNPLIIFDAFGLAIFTILGMQAALQHETSATIAIMMGVMSGVAGGLIRDLLTNQIPLILRHDLYATASLCGAIIYFMLLKVLPNSELVAASTAVLATIILRLSAWKWDLGLPIFPPTSPGK